LRILPYDNFDPKAFIVRDWLALDRTILANERTFLAWCRTSLTLMIAGVTFVRFFGHRIYTVIGAIFIAAGILIFTLGYARYRRMLGHYRALSKLEDSALPEALRRRVGE
jgi:putative membrane protein